MVELEEEKLKKQHPSFEICTYVTENSTYNNQFS